MSVSQFVVTRAGLLAGSLCLLAQPQTGAEYAQYHGSAKSTLRWISLAFEDRLVYHQNALIPVFATNNIVLGEAVVFRQGDGRNVSVKDFRIGTFYQDAEIWASKSFSNQIFQGGKMIKRMLKTQSIVVILAFFIYGAGVGNTLAADPSFDCSMVEKDSIEALICKDDELSALDRKMADVYAAAAQKAINEHPPVLKAEQRGWIKGRNDCWKSADKRQCVEESYRRRIAELEARYRLVPANGPFWYICGGDPRNEVVVTFFETDPPTLEAERGDQVSLMYLEPSASGARYQGRNESFWEHQGEATIVWGYGSPEMRCSKRP